VPRKQKTGMLRLRLVRSMIGVGPKERATIKGLGFRRMHQVVERQDTPEIRGMVAKAHHWVELVEGAEG
jgi:large subunit ribosomal protein L30